MAVHDAIRAKRGKDDALAWRDDTRTLRVHRDLINKKATPQHRSISTPDSSAHADRGSLSRRVGRCRLFWPSDGFRQGGHIEAQDLLIETVRASRSLTIACHSPRLACLAGVFLVLGDLFLRGFTGNVTRRVVPGGS